MYVGENQLQEDKFSTTFVDQVLSKRQNEFDGAWDKFSRTVTSHGRDLSIPVIIYYLLSYSVASYYFKIYRLKKVKYYLLSRPLKLY